MARRTVPEAQGSRCNRTDAGLPNPLNYEETKIKAPWKGRSFHRAEHLDSRPLYMVGKVGTRMTSEEKRKAAIEEMKPLLEALKYIRNKYGLAYAEVRARHFNDDTGNYSVITADDERYDVNVGEVYGLSWRDYEEEDMTNEYTEWIRQADEEEEVE